MISNEPEDIFDVTDTLFHEFLFKLEISASVRDNKQVNFRSIEKITNDLFLDYFKLLDNVVGQDNINYYLGYYASALFKAKPKLYVQVMKNLPANIRDRLAKDNDTFCKGWNIYRHKESGASYPSTH